jgi:hypothetical protein
VLFSINRFLIIGIILLILGFLLTPFLVGLLIMPVGAIFICYGTFLSIWTLIPRHQALEPKLKKFKDQYIESSPILTMIFGKQPQKKPDFKENN